MNRTWDIECYDNLFCAGFIDEEEFLHMFYLAATAKDEQDILHACEKSGYAFEAHDLRSDGMLLAKFMENPIPSDGSPTLLSDFLGTDNEVVKPKEDWYFAYNSINYDIPMIDYVLKSMVSGRVRVSNEALRQYSDKLIDASRAVVNTKPYLLYGNHVDLAFLNEKKIDKGRPTVGLKTLAGILGGSIVESESNKTGHSDDIHYDILYNINDISETKNRVFPGFLRNKFNTKKRLLDKYPHLRDYGITVNDTSAKFVEYIIAPEIPIKDTPRMTLMYPAPHKAKEFGCEPFDVLEDTKKWYMKNVYGPVHAVDPAAADLHLAKFMSICSYYEYFKGENWNESARHMFEYGIKPRTKRERKYADRTFGVILPFMDKYGNESPSYVKFSIGGIHGAELHKKQLDKDRAKIRELKEKYGKISCLPKNACSRVLLNLIIAQSRTSYKGYPVRLSHEIPYFFENTQPVDEIIDPDQFSPYMVKREQDKVTKEYYYEEDLIDRYKYTTSGHSAHQDFASYYPVLLINLGVFHDGHGRDPYEEVKDERIQIKGQLKTLERGSVEYDDVDQTQDGLKLILNSASGILDGDHDTNLRANNKAMAMRIIGQLFTFRIGMALALEGATIPSSNTDGIYATNIGFEDNKRIVEEVLEGLYIAIDPEEMFLVSKDANNRMEVVDGKVTSAKGGIIGSWKGAAVDQSLSHPALVDRILTDYLQKVDLDKPVDHDVIRQCIIDYAVKEDRRRFIYMASWVMRSTSGSIFIDDRDNVHPGTVRVWITKGGVKFTRYNARAQKVMERKADGKMSTLDEYASQLMPGSYLGKPEVMERLTECGVDIGRQFPKVPTVQQYLANRESAGSVYVVSETKISNLHDDDRLYIDNRCIDDLPEDEINDIFRMFDLEGYVRMIGEFAKSWHNVIVA
jgi:hypothetical protein